LVFGMLMLLVWHGVQIPCQ